MEGNLYQIMSPQKQFPTTGGANCLEGLSGDMDEFGEGDVRAPTLIVVWATVAASEAVDFSDVTVAHGAAGRQGGGACGPRVDHAREDMICVRQPGRVLQRGEWQTIDTRCLWVCSARSTRKRCSWSSRR